MDYLTKSEFYDYMRGFEVKLENRLTTLETKILNGKNKPGNPGNPVNPDPVNPNSGNGKKDLVGIIKYVIYSLIVAVLILAGVSLGANLLAP